MAGNGTSYSRTLLLNPGDRVWVKIPGKAFVGVGLVTGRRQPANLFQVYTPEGLKSIFEAAEHGEYLVDAKDDPETCEYFVPMKWLQTVPLSAAVYEIELFGNQNTICQPTAQKWRSTVHHFKAIFPKCDDAPQPNGDDSWKQSRSRSGKPLRMVSPPHNG